MTKPKDDADPKWRGLDDVTQNEVGGKTNTEHQRSNDGKATDRDYGRFGWSNAHWAFACHPVGTRSEV